MHGFICGFLLSVIYPTFIIEINGKNCYSSVDHHINKTKQTKAENSRLGILEANLRHRILSLVSWHWCFTFPKFLQPGTESFLLSPVTIKV